MRRRVVRPRPSKASPTSASEAGSGTKFGGTRGIVELVNDTLMFLDVPSSWVYDAEKNSGVTSKVPPEIVPDAVIERVLVLVATVSTIKFSVNKTPPTVKVLLKRPPTTSGIVLAREPGVVLVRVIGRSSTTPMLFEVAVVLMPLIL